MLGDIPCPRCQDTWLTQEGDDHRSCLVCAACGDEYFTAQCPACSHVDIYSGTRARVPLKCVCGAHFFDTTCPQCGAGQTVQGLRGQTTVTCAGCGLQYCEPTCPKCGLLFLQEGHHLQPSTRCPGCRHSFFQAKCPQCHVVSYYGGERQTAESSCPSTEMTCGCGQRFYDAVCPKCGGAHTYKQVASSSKRSNRLHVTRCRDCENLFFETVCPHCQRAQAFSQGDTTKSHLDCKYPDCAGTFFTTHCLSCTKSLMFKGRRDGSWLKCSCKLVFSEMLCPHCGTVCCISDAGQTDFKISCHACKRTFPQFPAKDRPKPQRPDAAAPEPPKPTSPTQMEVRGAQVQGTVQHPAVPDAASGVADPRPLVDLSSAPAERLAAHPRPAAPAPAAHAAAEPAAQAGTVPALQAPASPAAAPHKSMVARVMELLGDAPRPAEDPGLEAERRPSTALPEGRAALGLEPDVASAQPPSLASASSSPSVATGSPRLLRVGAGPPAGGAAEAGAATLMRTSQIIVTEAGLRREGSGGGAGLQSVAAEALWKKTGPAPETADMPQLRKALARPAQAHYTRPDAPPTSAAPASYGTAQSSASYTTTTSAAASPSYSAAMAQASTARTAQQPPSPHVPLSGPRTSTPSDRLGLAAPAKSTLVTPVPNASPVGHSPAGAGGAPGGSPHSAAAPPRDSLRVIIQRSPPQSPPVTASPSGGSPPVTSVSPKDRPPQTLPVTLHLPDAGATEPPPPYFSRDPPPAPPPVRAPYHPPDVLPPSDLPLPYQARRAVQPPPSALATPVSQPPALPPSDAPPPGPVHGQSPHQRPQEPPQRGPLPQPHAHSSDAHPQLKPSPRVAPSPQCQTVKAQRDPPAPLDEALLHPPPTQSTYTHTPSPLDPQAQPGPPGLPRSEPPRAVLHSPPKLPPLRPSEEESDAEPDDEEDEDEEDEYEDDDDAAADAPRAHCNGAPPPPPPPGRSPARRGQAVVLLLGCGGVGKSSLGNVLAGNPNAFATGTSTARSAFAAAELAGVSMRLIDTPAAERAGDALQYRAAVQALVATNRVTNILFVTPLHRPLTQTEAATMALFANEGGRLLPKTLFAFTHALTPNGDGGVVPRAVRKLNAMCDAIAFYNRDPLHEIHDSTLWSWRWVVAECYPRPSPAADGRRSPSPVTRVPFLIPTFTKIVEVATGARTHKRTYTPADAAAGVRKPRDRAAAPAPAGGASPAAAGPLERGGVKASDAAAALDATNHAGAQASHAAGAHASFSAARAISDMTDEEMREFRSREYWENRVQGMLNRQQVEGGARGRRMSEPSVQEPMAGREEEGADGDRGGREGLVRCSSGRLKPSGNQGHGGERPGPTNDDIKQAFWQARIEAMENRRKVERGIFGNGSVI